MAKQGFDPRKMMKKAVEIMRDSVHEQRDDSKPSPFVGTVLIKADGSVETACRGELRDGDHAEYLLIDKKNRDQKLDGSVLLTTLEPCLDKSRNFPKLGCATRIANARIKEVWVGIEDPDPTVDRKGIKYLEDRGITVHMFDQDLQSEIRKINSDYLEHAKRRAAEAEEEVEQVVLSKQDAPLANITLEEFSSEALEAYREKAKIPDKIDSVAFKKRLVNLELVEQDGNAYRPTGFGYILFGSNPRDKIHHAGLKVTIHKTMDSDPIIEDFNGPMVLIPNQLQKRLEDIFPSSIKRDQMERREISDLPLELIREAVVNSLIHRDWDIKEAKCQLEVNPNTITIKSPGQPVSPITLEQLQKFTAPTLSRNPKLHYIFWQMILAEERGFGMKTWPLVPEKYHLPLPKYTFENPYLVLTLYRSYEGAIVTLPPDILKDLSEDEIVGWKFISTQAKFSREDYEEATGFSEKKSQRHLADFIALGLLAVTGRGPNTRYNVIGNNPDKNPDKMSR